MKLKQLTISKKWMGIIMSIGLVLFPIHYYYQPLKQYFFLPWVGLALIAVSLYVLFMGAKRKDFSIGSKWVYIPMLVIIGSAYLRAIVYFNAKDLASALFLSLLFVLYLGARKLGIVLFTAFPYAVAIIAASVIVFGIITPGQSTGGFISNYCASAGFIILGFMASGKWQKILLPIVGLALFFTGSAEALFAVTCLGIIVLARRDVSKKMLLALLIVGVIAAIWFILGYGTPLYRGNGNLQTLWNILTGNTHGNIQNVLNDLTTDRWGVIKNAMRHISILGHGYDLGANDFTVHNVPLIIVDQLGIPAAIAWLVATMYCLIKTKWKYIWATVLILSVFDHYLWTQWAVIWWALLGVTTAVQIKSDYIFKDNT